MSPPRSVAPVAAAADVEVPLRAGRGRGVTAPGALVSGSAAQAAATVQMMRSSADVAGGGWAGGVDADGVRRGRRGGRRRGGTTPPVGSVPREALGELMDARRALRRSRRT